MPRFRKRPIVIEAERYTGPDGHVPDGVELSIITWSKGVPLKWAQIDTLEGRMEVSPGDWIVTGVQGEKYPVKPDIFKATYEPVKEEGEEGDEREDTEV